MKLLCVQFLSAVAFSCTDLPPHPAVVELNRQLQLQSGSVAQCTNVRFATREWHNLPVASERSSTIYSVPVLTLNGTDREGRPFEWSHVVGFTEKTRWTLERRKVDPGVRDLVLTGSNVETQKIETKTFASFSMAATGQIVDLRDRRGRSLCSKD